MSIGLGTPTPEDSVSEALSAVVEDVGSDLVGPGGSRFDRVVDAGLLCSGIAIGLLALAVAYNVISRQLFGRSHTWVFEYSEFGVPFLVFLGIAGVARSDGHVRMEIADEFLPPRALRRLSRATEVVSLLIAAMLTLLGAWITYRNYVDGTTIGLLQTPRWTVLVVIPVGAGMLFGVQLGKVRHRDRSATDPTVPGV